MKSWFATKKEAVKEVQKRNQNTKTERVFKWKHTKRKRPFFVGTEYEWFNI